MCLILNPFAVGKVYTDIKETKAKLRDDTSYSTMLLRRRFSKRLFLVSIIFALSFYLSSVFFGHVYIPKILKLTQLNLCPACYGISVCPELYSDQIILDHNYISLASFFNAKNIYYGHTKSNVPVVLKKLAHDNELDEFDSQLCKTWNLKQNCKPLELLNISANIIEDKIKHLVHFDWVTPPLTPRKGLVFCPYKDGVLDLVKTPNKHVGMKDEKVLAKSELLNAWTMLSINPEPIILQTIPRSKGWPVPKFGGVCGRLELVGHAGETLSALDLPGYQWHLKLHIAKQILDAAMDFTFKHERFRFYLMDWSLDNIAVNDKNEISFVDLEDIIVLDKHTPRDKHLPDWYQRYSKEFSKDPGFFFSIQKNCMHHLSDHNLYAACYILAGPDGLMFPIPDKYRNDTKLTGLVDDCLKGKGDRFQIVPLLQNYITHLLKKASKNEELLVSRIKDTVLR